MTHWISINKYLPGYGKKVLGIIQSEQGLKIDLVYLCELYQWCQGDYPIKEARVIYWQHLPIIPFDIEIPVVAEADDRWQVCCEALFAVRAKK